VGCLFRRCRRRSMLVQLLELLRNFSLDPAEPSTLEAKAAAAAELDAAADEAVASLKAQHRSALTTAVTTARNQTMTAALSAKISYNPGKPPLNNATAVGVINVALDEVTTAVASISSDEGGSLQGKRAAAEALMSMASIVDSTAAALAAVQEEDESAGEQGGDESAPSQLCKAAERLQDAAIKAAELKLRSEAATAAKSAAAEGEESENGVAAAEDQAAAAVAAVEEAMQAVREAVQQLPVTAAEPSADGKDQDRYEYSCCVCMCVFVWQLVPPQLTLVMGTRYRFLRRGTFKPPEQRATAGGCCQQGSSGPLSCPAAAAGQK